MKKKVLITQPWPTWYVSRLDEYIKQLEDAGCEVILDPKTTDLSEEEIIERMPGVYAHICGSDRWTAKAIDSCDSLKIISRIGIGYDNVDVKHATEKGIAVTTCPGAGAEAVAEEAFALMLAVGRQIVAGDKICHEGKWDKVIGPAMYRKTLGIIGLGRIGKKLVEIVRGFDMKIIAFDPVHDDEFAAKWNVTYVDSIDDLLKQADVISLHCMKNESTIGLIKEREFGLMKPRAILINCARGGLVDEKALYNALKEKKIYGAGFDVLVHEPIQKDEPLLQLDNFVMMPHNAGTSFEGKDTVVGMAVQNVVDIINGKKPVGTLNPEVL